MKRICNLAILPVVVCACSTGNAADNASLVPGDEIESQLAPGQAHTYFADLPSGANLVTVSQGGLDLIVEVSEPFSAIADSPTQRDDNETLLLESSSPVTVSITVSTDEYTGTTATYSIAVTNIKDPATISAHRLMSSAAQANHAGGNKNWQESLRDYSQAEALWQQTGNVAEQARALYSVAFLQYWQFSEWRNAADAAARAAELYGRVGYRGLAANARHLQAASLIEAASEVRLSAITDTVAADADAIFSEALSIFDAAASTQARLNNEYDKAQTINNIGLTHLYRDDLTLARRFFVQAAQEFERLGEWSGELNPLANLAVIDHEKGRLSSAVTTYERLLELIPIEREAAWRADTLDNLAAAQLLLGNTDGALQNFFAALRIHEELGSVKGQGRSVSGIGSSYLAIGEIELSREFLERALRLRREAHDGKGQVADLRTLANIHRILGQPDVSLDYHQQALELATSPLVRARVQVQQARDWIDAGDYRSAGEALIDAHQAADVAGAIRVSADAAFESGRLSAGLGDSQDGERWFHKAHDLYAAIGLQQGQAKSQLALARLAAENDIDAAIAYGLEAIELVEAQRAQVANLELRAVYLGQHADYYEFLIDALMRASTQTTNAAARSSYVGRALAIAERSRARATVDLINEAAIDFSQSLDPGILAQQSKLEERLIEVVYQRDQLLESNAGTDAVRALVVELQVIQAELDVLEAEARRSSPRYAELNDPAVLETGELQALLDPDTVVLQYALGDPGSFLWIITREQLRAVRIAGHSEIGALAKNVYQSLASPGLQPAAAREREANIRELSATVLMPAADELATKKRVVVAADGALQYVPFGVLSSDGATALNLTHDIVVVPSLTVVATQRQALQERTAPAITLAVIGDPVFNDSDPRLVAQNATRSGQAGTNPVIELSRLPFSGQEVEEIAALVEDSERLVATGFAASKDRIAGDQLQDYRYVHFATHGLIDATRPALTTLAFSMRDVTGTPVDGFLRLRDIYDLKLNADLVVLSACDTALGREIRGEGLIGMTQGFLYAGTPRVVASLWQVPDRATAELMTRFYTKMLREGQDPVAALHGAQREMASDRRWRDPYYWSGFVVQGDWR